MPEHYSRIRYHSASPETAEQKSNVAYQIKHRHYAEALYEALSEDAFYITLEKSIEDQQAAREAMLKYYDYSIQESDKYGVLLMPEERQFGVSIWSKPLPQDLQARCSREKKAFIANEMGEQALATYQQIVAFMNDKGNPLIDHDSWYLSILGVAPEFQGQGLGAKLLLPVLAESDRLGIPTYLETFTPRNKSFYRRLGYEDAGVFFEPTTRTEYSLMIREP